MKYMLFRFVSSPWTGPIRRSGVIISHIDMIESSWVPPVSFGNVRPSFLVTGPEGPVFPFQFTLRYCLVCKVHRLKSRGHIRAETGISGIKLTFPCRIRNRPPLRIIHVSDFFLWYIRFSIAPSNIRRLLPATLYAPYNQSHQSVTGPSVANKAKSFAVIGSLKPICSCKIFGDWMQSRKTRIIYT